MSTNQWTFLGICLGLILMLFLALPASAEFFQYVDNKGITHYTDTFSTIPPAYQSQVALHQIAPAPTEKNPEPEKRIIAQKTLLEKRDALNRKFEQLAAEKERIESARKTMTAEADIALLNDQIQKINENIRRFKKEEKRFIAEIERYNASLKPLSDD